MYHYLQYVIGVSIAFDLTSEIFWIFYYFLFYIYFLRHFSLILEGNMQKQQTVH